ncbi:MAG: type I secretion system permease/ATPase [Gammaproteobacteria bacterium]|nr:type I secretion system permease/ATPase [Gammaproteobacteria bacterium]
MHNKNKSIISQALNAFRGAFFAAGIFSLFINILVLTIPLYLLNVYTHVFASMSVETLIMLTIVAVGALVVQGLLEIIRSRVLVRVSAGIDSRLGEAVLSSTISKAAGSAQHSTQPMRDVNELRGFLGGPDVFRLIDIPLIPVFVGVLYFFDPLLSMIALAGAIVLFALAIINQLVTQKPLNAMNDQSMQSFNRVDDYVRNADVIKAMGMGAAITSRWQAENFNKLQWLRKAADRAGTISSTAHFVRMLLQVAIIGAGTYLYLQHEILAGTIIAASILMGRALAPVESAISTWKNVVSARSAYKRLVMLLEESKQDEVNMELPAPEGRISLDRIIVADQRKENIFLKNVGFEILPGEMLGIVGPSGAGKSTLGKVLVGITSPSTGEIRLDGAELDHWDSTSLGKYIGYLPQDVQLFGGTVAENIARMNKDANVSDIIAAAKLVGAHDLILRLPKGYETQVGEAGLALSSGQRQHIGLARAYYGCPKLVVLDEPNANLDSESEFALLKGLSNARQQKITQVVITHRPSVLQSSDKMLMLKDGTMELFGPSDKVRERLLALRDSMSANSNKLGSGSAMSVSPIRQGNA